MERLTEREYEVLKFAIRGMPNCEVAKKTFITEHTVKAHMTSIMKKLEVTNRTAAAFIALTNHLIKDEDLHDD